ncbi:MAG: MarR family transcriptional regulator [Dehalococcoidales bacterium]|jgi:DNA-binding MarR family transcriptional regulator
MAMNSADIDHILENLLLVFPVFHKKLLRMDLSGATGNLTRLHLGIMIMLSEGNMTVSELSRVSMVPKPQMTHLIDKLVMLGIVDRRPDTTDRRVINLALTEHGCVLLEDSKHKVQDNIKTRLAGLTPEELSQMAKALETLGSIGARL